MSICVIQQVFCLIIGVCVGSIVMGITAMYLLIQIKVVKK